MTGPTVKLTRPGENKNLVGFAEALDIIQPDDFDDEPTIPWGLVRWSEVDENDIIEEVPLG